MRRRFVICAAGAALLLAGLAGCDPGLLDPSGRHGPPLTDLKATAVAARYLAGKYPGTINSTLNDPVIVYHFTYANGVTLWALLLWHERTGNDALLEQVRASLAKYQADGRYRPHGGSDPIDYLGSMAHATLAYYLHTGDEQFLDEALDAADFFHDGVSRTPEGLIAHHSAPQRGKIWADALFMTMPLLAKAGAVLDDPAYHDDVLAQFHGFATRLRHPLVGLYHQGYNWHGSGPTPGFWGRANGWVVVAMTEALDAIPEDHPGRDELLALYQDFAAALVAHQGLGGMWHQLLNRPDSFEETSCTGLITYALARGVQRGWLPAEYAVAVRRAAVGLNRMISLTGDIANICPGTPPQSSESAYFNTTPRRNESHGIGPALLGLYGAALMEDLAE
jgi:rhamnogalacturonyl hydrolase YesR